MDPFQKFVSDLQNGLIESKSVGGRLIDVTKAFVYCVDHSILLNKLWLSGCVEMLSCGFIQS